MLPAAPTQEAQAPTHEVLDPSNFLSIAAYWAHRYRGTGDYDDLFQQACLGLLSARDTWVPEAGPQLGHVHLHVRRSLWLLGCTEPGRPKRGG